LAEIGVAHPGALKSCVNADSIPPADSARTAFGMRGQAIAHFDSVVITIEASGDQHRRYVARVRRVSSREGRTFIGEDAAQLAELVAESGCRPVWPAAER
jgi:hypothetical protein